MIITSYVPGRVRLRAVIFKDKEIYNRAENILKSSFGDAIKKYEYNSISGSILIEYDESKIQLDKLKDNTLFFKKLNYQAEHFSNKTEKQFFLC